MNRFRFSVDFEILRNSGEAAELMTHMDLFHRIDMIQRIISLFHIRSHIRRNSVQVSKLVTYMDLLYQVSLIHLKKRD
jgi:hypothetical protein